jgi:predicted transcriptional regulator
LEGTLNQPDDQGMQKEMVVTDLEAVRALTDPLKMQILEAVGPEPKTVKQIATSLKVVPNNLYYHINQLENLKLIRVVSTRVVSGIIEKQYSAAAMSYTFSRSLISLHNTDKEEVREVMHNRILSLMDMTLAEVKDSIQAGLLEPPLIASMMLHRHKFTQAQIELMAEKLQALINSPEFEEVKDADKDLPHLYRMVVNMFPLVENSSDEAD